MDITPQYGIETGLNLETVDNISLRPILKEEKIKMKIGKQNIEYTEIFLGTNLITIPDFIEEIVESASPSEITLFPADLAKTLENDYQWYERYNEEASRKFILGELTTDNLFCVQLKLHERQWGKELPNKEDQELLVKHLHLHGEQNVANFRLRIPGHVTFDIQGVDGPASLAKDAILEARVMIRQLLEKSLPYYTLEQIINFQREWLNGSRSEYALAGNLLFSGLLRKTGNEDNSLWAQGVEKFNENQLYQFAVSFAYRNKNFIDMLTKEQLAEGQSDDLEKEELND